jgi:hypothetical protein
LRIHSKNLIRFGVMPIITQLISYQHNNAKANRHANRQSEDVDKRKKLMPGKVADGNFKIIPDHKRGF